MAASIVAALSLGAGVKVMLSDPDPKPEPKVSTLELTPVPVLEVVPVARPTDATPPALKTRKATGTPRLKRSTQKVASLERIAQCESKGSYTAKNPSSSASGNYQILDSTWRGTSPGKLKDEEGKYVYPSARSAPPAQQDTAAQELWNNGKGASHWRACL